MRFAERQKSKRMGEKTMERQSTITKNILILLLVASSSSIAAQSGKSPDLSNGVDKSAGSGTTNPDDPLVVLPDGQTILRSGKILAPGEVPPNASKKGKAKGMRQIDPPVLKQSGPNGLPVHDVRKDVGGTSTESKLKQLKLLHKRMLNPDRSESGIDPEVVKRDYNRLYRELDDEQRVSRSKGIRMPVGPVKSEIARQNRVINNVLDSMPAPPTGRPQNVDSSSFNDRTNANNDYFNIEIDMKDVSIHLGLARSAAQKAMNSGNRERTYSALKNLKDTHDNWKAILDESEETLKRLLKYDFLPGSYIAKSRQKIREAVKDYQDFLKFQKNYEEVFYRKWPIAPHQKLEAPEIGPLPTVIGSP